MKKNIKFWIIMVILVPVMLCTIKDDNGNPVNPGRDTSVPVIEEDVIPSLFVTPDSLYLFPGDTLGIKVRVFADTTLKDSIIKPLILFPVVAKANKGKIIKDTVLTDSNGRAKILFTDTTAGNVELVVTAGSVSKTVRFDVTNTPIKVQKLFSISTERSVIKADGKDSTIISVLVLNTFRNPLSNECVQFITTAGKIRGIREGESKCGPGSGIGITGSDGVARAILTSANLNDTAYVTAYLVSDQSLSDEVQVTFQGISIELNASKNNIKRGDTVIITAKVVNASGIPLARVPIYFTKEKGNASNLIILSYDSITNYEGVAIVKVSATANGSDAIIVSSCGTVVRQQINVTSLLVNLELDKTILQTQTGDTSKIIVTFVNSEKLPLSGRTVKLTKLFKNEKGSDTTEVIVKNTDSNGKCYFFIPAIGWESIMKVNVTAFDNNEGYASVDTIIQFITTRIMTIRPPQPIPADGVSKGVVTVYIKNKSGNPIVGDVIAFTTTAGIITAQSKTDEFGKAEAYLISERRNIVAEVTATLSSDPTKQQKTTVIFKGVEIYASANPSSIRNNGIDSSNVLIRLVDAAGIPIMGERFNISKKLSGTIIKCADSVTDNNGEALCKIYGTDNGRDTIEISAAGASTKVVIYYSSNILIIDTVSGQECIADSTDSTIFEVTYLKGDGISPIEGAKVEIAATVGKIDTIFTGIFTTDSRGKATFKLKNPHFAVTTTIFGIAYIGDEITSASKKVYFKAAKVRYITLTATPEVISINGGRARIEAIAFDSSGNRVKDAKIAFNILNGPSGGEYLDPPVGITGDDGKAVTYLVAGKTPSYYRQVWICAGNHGGIISDTVKLTIAGPPYSINVATNILKGKNPNDGTFILPCAAIVTDVNGNPVVDGTEVNFSLKISGVVIHRLGVDIKHTTVNGVEECSWDTIIVYEVLPFEDFNENFILDAGEDRNHDGILNRGENINGDRDPNTNKDIWIVGPPFRDINRDGIRQYYLYSSIEPVYSCGSKKYFCDLTKDGKWDPFEPLNDYNYLKLYDSLKGKDVFWRYLVEGDTLSIEERDMLSRLLQMDSIYIAGGPYDVDVNKNGVCDPKTAVAITRTTKTEGGKALNEIIYGQSDATYIEVMIWAESQGVVSLPEKLILPIVKD